MTRVCVIFGGQSSEHEVSLRSATCVLENIDRSKYEVIMVGINKEGRWYRYAGPIELIASGAWEYSEFLEAAVISPDPSEGGILLLGEVMTPSKKLRQKILSPNKPVRSKVNHNGLRVIPVDIVFPVIHGKNGEDGTIQGLLEMSGIPYVGCGVLSSAACMDKEITHSILLNAGIAKTKLIAVTWWDMGDFAGLEERLSNEIGYPMYVKPANAGSSVGITKVKESGELKAAMELALKHDTKVVVERAVVGREIECAVWGNTVPDASNALGEVIPTREFYDYEGKYLDDSAGLVAPADLEPEINEKVREIAAKAYKAMGCRGLARVDFFVLDNGDVILNEINTMPGFTSISMYPRLFVEDGLSITELIDNLIDCGFSVE